MLTRTEIKQSIILLSSHLSISCWYKKNILIYSAQCQLLLFFFFLTTKTLIKIFYFLVKKKRKNWPKCNVNFHTLRSSSKNLIVESITRGQIVVKYRKHFFYKTTAHYIGSSYEFSFYLSHNQWFWFFNCCKVLV